MTAIDLWLKDLAPFVQEVLLGQRRRDRALKLVAQPKKLAERSPRCAVDRSSSFRAACALRNVSYGRR